MIIQSNAPVLVTGGSGFIGGRLVERLLADGRYVRVLSRRPLPALSARGVEVVVGDLGNTRALDHACHTVDTVFHCAARVGVWGPMEDYRHVNVDGSRRLISACRQALVARLIFTSSPSAVYNGRDLRNVDESAPLCLKAPCAYPVSKAEAEKEVLFSNNHRFATVALRPHLVFGPGDRNLVPRILALARSGRLRIVGNGLNKVDLTHIDNVVDAHLLAERALERNRPNVGGRAYFITNGEPVVLWDWINYLLHHLGIPEVRKSVPLSLVHAAGAVLEKLWQLAGREGEPPMTRFVAKELATEHYFDIRAARRDLAYHPRVTLEEGTKALIAHYKAGHAY